MCIATPMKIKVIKDGKAVVEHGGKDFNVSLQLIPRAKVGDWVLAHGELAINILPENEAFDILELISKTKATSGR